MHPSIAAKLEQLQLRHQEISGLLAEPEIIVDQNRFRTLSQEYAQLEPVVSHYQAYCEAVANYAAAQDMAHDTDPDIRALAEEEQRAIEVQIAELEQTLQLGMLPSDPYDDSNLFLEVRAGTGGDEAALFAGDLFRMYSRYAETQGWQIELMSASEGEHGGYKEIIARIIGHGAYSRLKFESGAHRVQRVPETESQGRIHTSAATVAVLPEVAMVDSVDINSSDLRVDTYRSSGAGGQHVNRTDSAVRITHLPSGIVVECQDERSQHKNRARAMSLLAAKLLVVEQTKQTSEQERDRRLQVGSGDRSERIRTYNFPQGRITDHRVNLTLYQLTDVLQGDLDPIIAPLLQEYQAEQLAALAADV